MSNFKEAIEERVGPIPGYIDTSEFLSEYYGPDSLACHGVRQIDDTHYEAFFLVPENICGPKARPPMFDKLRMTNQGFETETDEGDAWQHFIDTVVINGTSVKLVPGHKIAGLQVEMASIAYNQGRENSVDLMMTDIAAIHYRGFVLPHQNLLILGDLQKEDEAVVSTPKVYANETTITGETKPKTDAIKLRCETVGYFDDEIRPVMMLQHWLFETTAQGFGFIAGLNKGIKDKIPILLQSERSRYGKVPIKAGDLVSTRFELTPSPEEQGFGHSEIFVNGASYGSQRRLMVRFYSLDEVAAGIALAKGGQAA